MKITVKSFFRESGELWLTNERSLEEYTEWLFRAAARGYKVKKRGSELFIYGGKGTADFIVTGVRE